MMHGPTNIKNSLRLLDHMVLRKIFVPKKVAVIGRWRKLDV